MPDRYTVRGCGIFGTPDEAQARLLHRMRFKQSAGILFSTLGSVAAAAALLLLPAAPDSGRPPGPEPSPPAASEPAPPVWLACLTPLDEALRQPETVYRSILPSRGLAAAAMVRPSAVLASWEMEHHQDGAELVNLTLAMEALDRLLLPPGAELSFNSAVGPRLEERGFLPGLMYAGGRVVRGVGGGVCVASTALYNAALLAGLPILERWMHSGPTSYAAPTRDAAVVYGAKDLRIRNNTSHPIWVRAFVEDGRVRVSLLSVRRQPFEVRLVEEGPAYIAPPLQTTQGEGSEPVVLDEGAPGCDRRLIRQFVRDGRVIAEEEVCRDVRRPRPRILAVAGAPPEPATVSPSPSLDEPAAPETPASGIPARGLTAPVLDPRNGPEQSPR